MKPTDWEIPERFGGREREKIARLLEHDDADTVTVGGEERPFLICRASLRLARKHGVDADAALRFEAAEDADGAVSEFAQFERYALFLWMGCVPFEPDLAPDDLADLVAPADFARTIRDSTRGLARSQAELAELLDAVGKSPAAAETQGAPEPTETVGVPA